jgi:hypothetical protein
MYLYWRINNDLYAIGEGIVFHDPRFIRCFGQWMRKNSYALALAEGWFDLDFSLSLN